MDKLSKRQKEIIAVSINIIAEKGIQCLTIKNISKSIKISEPAIYRHFDNKMDILTTILSRFKNDSQIALSNIKSEKISALECIESIYNHNCRIFSDNPALTAVIFSEEIFKNSEQLSNIVNSIMQVNYKMIIGTIKSGQMAGEVRIDISKKHIVLIIMGALRLLVTKWRLSKYSFDLEQEGSQIFNTIKKLIKVN